MRIRNRRPEPLALDLLKSEGADSMPIGEVTRFQAA
jgi:hypothetical protein